MHIILIILTLRLPDFHQKHNLNQIFHLHVERYLPNLLRMLFVLFNSLSHARRKARACVIIIMVFDVYLKSQGTILEILRTFSFVFVFISKRP